MTWLYILIPIFIEGLYDYLIWNGYFKEQSGHRLEPAYRVFKETMDLIIIPGLLVYFFNWSWDLLTAFYIFKWFGWCDAVYIMIWKLRHPYSNYTQEGIWWMWFTPLGIIRSQIVYARELSTFNPNDVMQLKGNYWLIKGKLALWEFNLQLIVGTVLSYIIYIILS